MKIQAGIQVSRQGELRRHLRLWKCFGRLYFIVIVLDRNIMKSSSDSDQELSANMVFMAKMEKILSNSEENSSSAEETIAEVYYFTFDSESEYEFETSDYYDNYTNFGLFVDNDDNQETFHDAIEFASEKFGENHIVS
ncbi:hypothetical protein Tco_0983460 [Tanacetum coccineum]